MLITNLALNFFATFSTFMEYQIPPKLDQPKMNMIERRWISSQVTISFEHQNKRKEGRLLSQEHEFIEFQVFTKLITRTMQRFGKTPKNTGAKGTVLACPKHISSYLVLLIDLFFHFLIFFSKSTWMPRDCRSFRTTFFHVTLYLTLPF